MSLPIIFGIGVLGGVGTIARFALDGRVAARLGRRFPYGTLAVNVFGSLLLGVLVGVGVSANTYRLAGTGLIGAFTTFSTLALESHRLAEEGERSLATLNVVISLLLGIAAVWAGRAIGATL